MLPYLPLLISANTLGVISLLIFLASTIILTIPVFATRGSTQLLWAAVVGFVLTVEAAILVTLVVLTARGTIFQ
jgi:hypothetical protein